MELFFLHTQKEPLAKAAKSALALQEIDSSNLIKQKLRQSQRPSAKFSLLPIHYNSKDNGLFDDTDLSQIFFKSLERSRLDDHRVRSALHDARACFGLIV